MQGTSEIWANLSAAIGESTGILVSVLLTCMVLSFLFGGNVLSRLAQHIFIGVAAGYAAATAWSQMLQPRLALLLADPVGHWYYGVFFVLGLLLCTRGSKTLSVLANLPLGILFGIGASLALGGTLTGSLVPQLRASIVPLVPLGGSANTPVWLYIINAVVLVLGTVAVLSATHFAQGKGVLGRIGNGLLRASGTVGRGLLMVTLGALFAGAALTFYAILNSRVLFLVESWQRFSGNVGLFGP